MPRGNGVDARLYNRLAVLRAERGVSRQQLADDIGVNYQTIGYLERGDYNPSLSLALQLAEYFELPVEAVFSRTPLGPMSSELFRSASPALSEVRPSVGGRAPRAVPPR